MLFEEVVVDVKAEFAQILDGKYSGGPGIALAESVDLPDPGDETGNMLHGVCRADASIREGTLLGKIIVQRLMLTYKFTKKRPETQVEKSQ